MGIIQISSNRAPESQASASLDNVSMSEATSLRDLADPAQVRSDSIELASLPQVPVQERVDLPAGGLENSGEVLDTLENGQPTDLIPGTSITREQVVTLARQAIDDSFQQVGRIGLLPDRRYYDSQQQNTVVEGLASLESISNDPKMNEAAQQILDRLAAGLGYPADTFRAVVVNDSNPRAASIGNGVVAFSTGLFEMVREREGAQADLAKSPVVNWIAAHELGHDVLRHAELVGRPDMRLNVLIREQYGERADRERLTELSKLYISRQFELAADDFAVRSMQEVYGEDSQQMLLQAAEELDWIGAQGVGSNHILALPFDRTHPDLNGNRILDYLGL